MHIVIASDSFKESLSAQEMAQTLKKAYRQCRLKAVQFSDGLFRHMQLLFRKFN